jgi:hypothetical protein
MEIRLLSICVRLLLIIGYIITYDYPTIKRDLHKIEDEFNDIGIK